MSGPKIDVEHVQAAIAVVDDAYAQMNGVTAKVLAQSDAAAAAMTAPAGQITSAAFSDLGGAGKALAEELERLRVDLTSTISVAESGSDEPAAVAQQGGLAQSVAAGI